MAKIFVSHAHEDREAAHQITAALSAAELDPWLDVQELRGGDELLRRLAEVLAAAEHFAIGLTRRALTRPWVLTEMRMALTREIEPGRPKVIVLLVDDCEVPIELRHKAYLDFRGRFDAALGELADHVRGVTQEAPTPKQAILAGMIRNADPELWARLCAGTSVADDWRRSEVADVLRELRSAELGAAVAIGSRWSGRDYEAWEDDLAATMRHATGGSEASARRTVRRRTVRRRRAAKSTAGRISPKLYRSKQDSSRRLSCDTGFVLARRWSRLPVAPLHLRALVPPKS